MNFAGLVSLGLSVSRGALCVERFLKQKIRGSKQDLVYEDLVNKKIRALADMERSFKKDFDLVMANSSSLLYKLERLKTMKKNNVDKLILEDAWKELIITGNSIKSLMD